MNVNRFKQLLESTLGNVKPLLSEATDPPTGEDPEEGKVEVTPQDKEQIGSFLYNKVMNIPEIHADLGIGDHDSKETVLDKLSHTVHTHYDPLKKHFEFELPGFGKTHNIKPIFGFSLNSHGDGHDAHGATQTLLHSKFEFGARISLGDFFK